MTRIPFQTQSRAGAVTLLTAYATSASIKLQIYPGRPRSINPPCAFVDLLRETLTEFTITTRQRTVSVEVVVVFGLFDSQEAANQKDAFADGFADWCADNFHAFGTNTLMASISIDDDPNYVPNWLPDAQQGPYYASRITLEGFAAT